MKIIKFLFLLFLFSISACQNKVDSSAKVFVHPTKEVDEIEIDDVPKSFANTITLGSKYAIQFKRMPAVNSLYKVDISKLNLGTESDAEHLFDFLRDDNVELDWENKTYYLLMNNNLLKKHNSVSELNKYMLSGVEDFERALKDIEIEKQEVERDRKEKEEELQREKREATEEEEEE